MSEKEHYSREQSPIINSDANHRRFKIPAMQRIAGYVHNAGVITAKTALLLGIGYAIGRTKYFDSSIARAYKYGKNTLSNIITKIEDFVANSGCDDTSTSTSTATSTPTPTPVHDKTSGKSNN